MKTLTLLALGALAGCALPTMQVRPELVDGAQLPFDRPVFGTGSRVSFGTFKVADVDRSPFEGSGANVGSALFPEWLKSLGSMTRTQDYAFSLEEPGQPPRLVRCRAELNGSEVQLARSSVTNFSQHLHCAIALDASAQSYARLELNDGKGALSFGARSLAVEARDLRGQPDPSEPAGYVITDGAHDLAAGQLVNSGAAWIAKDLDAPTRSVAAGAVAALLLYRAPDTQ